ncbi:MAG: flagellar motor switch protein FliN [Leptospiraceae bacterium]|nr:flagellar motor switch protein FliN [Leptospiraceae bacterium]
MGEGSLSQDDIDALLGSGSGGSSGGSDALADLDALVGATGGGGSSDSGDEGPSFADIAAALGPSSTPAPSSTKQAPKAQSSGGNTANLNLLLDVTLSLTVELGRTNMFIKDVLQLSEGNIVELDKNVGEELDVLANGKPIGRGKLIVIDDYYGVQITQILDPSERL